MTDTPNAPAPAAPPTRHQLAVMIWLCVLPTLTAINVTFGNWLAPMSPVLRTFILATIAVPVVMYGLMPRLHRARAHVLARRRRRETPASGVAAWRAGHQDDAEPPNRRGGVHGA